MSHNPRDGRHSWRYASGKYPAPDGIRFIVDYVGVRHTSMHEGSTFYNFTAGYLSVHDPANGGYPVCEIERGFIKRLEIEAI